MSATYHVRVPPVAPQEVDVDVTDKVQWLIHKALFDDGNRALIDPDEALSSTDGGMTGGQLLSAKGTSRTFLDGALAALPVGDDRRSLTAVLDALDRHGALLITKERH